MNDKVHVGVVGTSWWADLMHLPSLKSHPHAKITAIAGRNHDRAEEMAKKYKIPLVFNDYREMIEKGDLHAIVVAVPDDLHYAVTMDALDAHLHVLCEKPLAMNASDARAMYEKAEAAGVKHMTYFTWRWIPHFRYLRQLIAEGYIGRCFHCQIGYVGGYGRGRQYGWRFDRNRSNGILADLGSHMVDFARWYIGDIAKVSACLSTFVERSGIDGQPLNPANEAALLTLQFANGAQGIIYVSAVAHVGERGQEQRVVLHGESGTLEAERTFIGGEIRGARHDEKQFSTLFIPGDLWGDVDRDKSFDVFSKQSVGDRLFIDSIIEDRPVSPNFYDGLKVQEVIDAAIESHQKGCWVSLP